jgi:transcriptional regulator with XRE-family HTH domain
MPESFGARLRQRRERQQISLATISEQTKIKLSLLEALERDDVSSWPSGIFRRAFIRTYAQAIGLNADEAVREFLELYPDPIEVVEAAAALAQAVDGGAATTGPPTRLQYLVGSAIDSLSRLRRGPASDDVVPAECPPVKSQPWSERDFPPAPQPFREARAMAPFEPALAAEPEPLDTLDFEFPVVGRQLDSAEPEPLLEHAPAPQPLVSPAPASLAAAVPEPLSEPAPPVVSQTDILAAAHLCTELGRVDERSELGPLLQKAARILDAIGVIIWIWDAEATELRPALAYGYSDKVLAQLPTVTRDTDNATAAAFRSSQTCAINGSERASGALAVPLLTPVGCQGVLAIELPHGSERMGTVRALVTIFAAQLARLIRAPRPAEATDRRLA